MNNPFGAPALPGGRLDVQRASQTLSELEDRVLVDRLIDSRGDAEVIAQRWHLTETGGLSVTAYVNRRERLAVHFAVRQWPDGKAWLQVTLLHRDRIPTWDEVARAKETFLGQTRALVVLDAEVMRALHPHAIAFWACLDDESVVPALAVRSSEAPAAE